MRYIITEEQYKNLNEVVGVPTNVVDIARQLYNRIMSKLNPNTKLKSFFTIPITLMGEFQINDYRFDTIEVVFDVDSLDNYDVDGEREKVYIRGMSQRSTVKMTDNFNYTLDQDTDKIDISIKLTIDDDVTAQDIIDKFTEDRVRIISSLAHEIKHGYDEFANPISKTHKRVEYQIGNTQRFGDIEPLNKLLLYMYFAHTTENLVRATELSAVLEEEGITKEDFYRFITNNDVYTIYRNGANLSYEGLRSDLKDIVPEIKKILKGNNIDYEINATDDEIVDLTLFTFFDTLKDWRGGIMRRFLIQNQMEHLFGFEGDKKRYFDKYLAKIDRFGDDYKKFIKYEINQTRNICLKMMKKLSKLYSLLKEKNNPPS
jgi:hypothetical protein